MPGLLLEVLQLLIVMQILAKGFGYDMVVGVSRRVVDAAVVADAEQTDDRQEKGNDDDEDGQVLDRIGTTSWKRMGA